jgi:hypothetical protein
VVPWLVVAVLPLLPAVAGCTPEPPATADRIVLVHGLGRTSTSMTVLRSRLQGAGYRVLSFGYPSRSEPMEALVDRLADSVRVWRAGDPAGLHFVTHSMGGVLVRSYLAEQPEPFPGRVVMLSPPSQGSEIVDALADSPLLTSLLGPAGARLGTDSAGIAGELAPVDFSLGIITGDRSFNPLGSWLIPGPDDGKVGVSRAWVEGAEGFLVLPGTHTFIMNRRDVAEEVLHFIRHGTFVDDGPDPARVVENQAPRWGPAEVWRVGPEARLSLGVLDGGEAYQLVSIAAAARQSDGDLVVADAGARTVRLYGPDGAHRRMLGGPGRGPGEFQNPQQIRIGAGDSILVWDDAAYRLTRFGPDGELAGVQTVSREAIARSVEPPLYPGRAWMLSGGELLVRLVEKSKEMPTTGRFRPRSGVLRVSDDGSAARLLMAFGGAEQVMVEAPWGPSPVVPPFARDTHIAVHPTEARACVGEGDGPSVVCFAADGRRTESRWPAEALAVRRGAAEVARWRAATADLYRQKLDDDDLRRLLAAVPVPDVRPPYSALRLDAEGHLWVRRGPTEDGEGIEHLVFDSGGVLLGRVSMPPIRVLEIGADYVLGVSEDALEVEYIRLYPLTKPS